MLEFLKQQVRLLEDGAIQREFSSLVMEAESRLVAENAMSFLRRAHIRLVTLLDLACNSFISFIRLPKIHA